MEDTAASPTITSAAPEAPRQVSPALTAGIMFLPLIFSWFLLRKGYTMSARVVGFGWAAILLVLGQLAPDPEAQKPLAVTPAPAAKMVADKSAPTARQPVVSTQPAVSKDLGAEEDYLSLLDKMMEDARSKGLIQKEDRARTTWVVSVGRIGSIVTSYVQDEEITLSPAGKAHKAAWKREIGNMQAKSFPRLRVIHAEALDEALWEGDIRVKATGSGSSTLRLTGYPFAANRNIKLVMDKIAEDARAVRVRRVEFQPYEGGPVTFFDIKPLPDTALATFLYNQWTPVE